MVFLPGPHSQNQRLLAPCIQCYDEYRTTSIYVNNDKQHVTQLIQTCLPQCTIGYCTSKQKTEPGPPKLIKTLMRIIFTTTFIITLDIHPGNGFQKIGNLNFRYRLWRNMRCWYVSNNVSRTAQFSVSVTARFSRPRRPRWRGEAPFRAAKLV